VKAVELGAVEAEFARLLWKADWNCIPSQMAGLEDSWGFVSIHQEHRRKEYLTGSTLLPVGIALTGGHSIDSTLQGRIQA